LQRPHSESFSIPRYAQQEALMASSFDFGGDKDVQSKNSREEKKRGRGGRNAFR